MKNILSRFFRGFSLRQRFLVAPLLGLVVCSLLTAAFIYESQRQNALLVRITERDLTAFNHYAEVFADLTEQHTGLYDLLNSAGKIDEATLYDQAKQHLYMVGEAVNELEQALPPIDKSVAPDFAALRDELSASVQAYRKGVSAAVGMATVNVAHAPDQLVRANERFTAMSRSFVKLLDLERAGIISEITASVRQGQIRSATIAFMGVSIAALLFFLSRALSRMLSRKIETQIGILTDLGVQAGARMAVEGSDEVERMTQAVAAFRQSLLDLNVSHAELVEHKRELEEQEQRAEVTLRSIGDAVITTDAAARVEFLNPVAEQLSGWALSEAKDRPITEILHLISATTGDPVVTTLHQALAENRIVSFRSNTDLVRRDASRLAIEDSAAPIHDRSGKIIGGVLIFRDVSDRARIEASLHASEELMRSTFDNAAVGIVHTSLAGEHLHVNRKFSELTGYSVEELLSMSSRELAHPDDLADHGHQARRLAAGEIGEFSQERRYVRKDGSLIWAKRSVSLVRDSAGNPLYFIRVVEDVTERKLQESRIAQLSRVLAVTSHINALIVRAGNRQELFDGACRIAAQYGNFRMVWIGILDRDSMTVKPVASEGLDDEFVRRLHVSVTDNGTEGQGTTPRAIRSRQPAWDNDIAVNPGLGYVRGYAADRGMRSAITLPLLVGGEVEGSFAFYAAEAFNEDEIKLLGEMAANISFALEHIAKAKAIRVLTDQRSWEAAHDVLTGLVNRREFESLVEVSVASAQNAGKHHVVAYMDLDQFKVVNDTCGHAAGDDLLKELSALLQSHIRESDTLARLGGDEFGLLLEGCSLERAQLIAADLLAAVGDFRFNWDGKVFTVGVSIGLATVTADSTSSAEILSMADTACYWAKEQGRNRVSVYRTGDSDMAVRRREMGWIARINSALAEDRFTLYHQTYLPLNTAAGACKHLEVLIRMIDEEGNLVQPGSFLPAAERYNLMPAIDRWVVGTVFSRYHDLVADRGGEPVTVAINLSGTSLNAEGFLDFVRQQALEHALPAQSICFEITETSAINNLRKATEFIRECKAMGFLFALDDFGTGTSSFGYLKNLPVDYLKIDGGFVKNMERDAIDKAMTETINRIGHIMGIKTVAEYAENDAIIQELRTMGVDYAQGYGVCKPTPLFERSAEAVTLPRAA